MPAAFGTTSVVRMHDSLWTAATQHPFLDAVREGSISAEAFDRWLVQDVLFVTDLLTFQARLLARAPRRAQEVVAGGCVALVAELDWFEAKAAERSLSLGSDPLPATLAYRQLLTRLDAAPADAATTALWAIEKVYLLAWSHAKSGDSPFAEFVEHWTVPEFAAYVEGLEQVADPDTHSDLVRDVLEHEIAFWDMALEK